MYNDTESPKKNKVKIPDEIKIDDVQISIKPMKKLKFFVRRKSISESSLTNRMAKRLMIMYKLISARGVIENVLKLMRIITHEEKRMGYKEAMCRRSIYPLIDKLRADNNIRLWQISLRYKQVSTEHMFMSAVNIEADNHYLLSLVEKEKYRFILRISNEQNRQNQLVKAKLNKEKRNDESSQADLDIPKKVLLTGKDKVHYGNSPKFIRMRTLHEYLFYLVYTDPSDRTVIEPHIAIEQWKTIHSQLNYDEIETELDLVYSTEIDWKMFVRPYQASDDYPKGWIQLSDILLRVPLSIFVKIYNTNCLIPGLNELLLHPIRKHYLVCNLPITIKSQLVATRRHIQMIDEVVKRCAAIGLVQMGSFQSKAKENQYIYVNRYASIMNTTESLPGYCFITKKEYQLKSYIFNTMDDVTSYWHSLYRICLGTMLGLRLRTDESPAQRPDLRDSILLKSLRAQSIESARENDNGTIPGDHMGAGGLDSSLYAHLQRNWSFNKIHIRSAKTNNRRRPPSMVKIIKINRRATVASGKKKNIYFICLNFN